MGRRWIITVFILLAVSLLAWGEVRSGIAKEDTLAISKPERFYSRKILKKIDEVLKNQELILKELKVLKAKE